MAVALVLLWDVNHGRAGQPGDIASLIGTTLQRLGLAVALIFAVTEVVRLRPACDSTVTGVGTARQEGAATSQAGFYALLTPATERGDACVPEGGGT